MRDRWQFILLAFWGLVHSHSYTYTLFKNTTKRAHLLRPPVCECATELAFKGKTRELSTLGVALLSYSAAPGARHNGFASIVKNESGEKHKHTLRNEVSVGQEGFCVHVAGARAVIGGWATRVRLLRWRLIQISYLPTRKMHLCTSLDRWFILRPSNGAIPFAEAQRPTTECSRSMAGLSRPVCAWKNSHFALGHIQVRVRAMSNGQLRIFHFYELAKPFATLESKKINQTQLTDEAETAGLYDWAWNAKHYDSLVWKVAHVNRAINLSLYSKLLYESNK